MALGSVSKRIKAIYQRYYEDREEQRFVNLYAVFDRIAALVDASEIGARLEIDYLSLAEIVRSYFLDTIRYKEYHFDPKADAENFIAVLEGLGGGGLEEIDPLSPQWTELVHRSANINSSKVAAYTVKWILRYKPIAVISDGSNGLIDPNADLYPSAGKGSFLLSNINEHFALQSAFLALGVDAAKVPADRIRELIYCFRFRSFDESAYFMILSEDYLCSKWES